MWKMLASAMSLRLHKSSDGDIFVPHGSITILGTTSMSIPDAEDTSTSREEVEKLLSIGTEHIDDILADLDQAFKALD